MLLLAEKSPLKLLLYGEGHVVLFATRAKVENTEYLEASDRERFLVKKEGVLTVLYPESLMKIPQEVVPNTVYLVDKRLPEGENEKKKEISQFNFFRSLS